MAKFVYRMQNILELKQKMETQEKMAFGIANAKLHEEQDKLQELLLRRAGYDNELKEASCGNIDLQRIQQIKRAIDSIKVKIRDQMFAIRRAQKELDMARMRLDAVMKDRKTHENLREHALDEFKEEAARQENKEIDELVSFTYGSEHKH
ncbi:MAG: flagellar export protein FliJ [Lachnospiraceae bacterium]|nr:flagellar export protein FliJ [Lachnospiraceae bacterium]